MTSIPGVVFLKAVLVGEIIYTHIHSETDRQTDTHAHTHTPLNRNRNKQHDVLWNIKTVDFQR